LHLIKSAVKEAYRFLAIQTPAAVSMTGRGFQHKGRETQCTIIIAVAEPVSRPLLGIGGETFMASFSYLPALPV
jgi:hypothetical protein